MTEDEKEKPSAWDPDELEEVDIEVVYCEGYIYRTDNPESSDEDCPYDDAEEMLMVAWLQGWHDANTDMEED